MKLGQVIKNILQELSEKKWETIHVYFDHFGIQITIDPKYTDEIESFFKITINYLQQSHPFYKNIWAMVTGDIYFSLLIAGVDNVDNLPLLNPLLKEIEAAMAVCAEKLSKNWIESSIPINKLFSYETLLKKYGDELIILEQAISFRYDAGNILKFLKNENQYLGELLMLRTHLPSSCAKAQDLQWLDIYCELTG